MQTVAAPKQQEAPTGVQAPVVPAGSLLAFSLVTGLFFLWGIPNNLNDVLIRQFMKSFALTRFEAGLIQSAFYLGYFLLALPAGLLMKKKGYKAGFLTGLCLFATGCFLFYPAAIVDRYSLFLAALFIVASGLAFLETAANPFIAQLGATSTAATRLNLSQAFNPIGSILGVLLGTFFIFSGVELTPAQVSSMTAAGTYTAYLRGETNRVVLPYLFLGGLALLWAVAIARVKLPHIVAVEDAPAPGDWKALFRRKLFCFALLAQFFYVGAQVGTWSFFIQYAQQYAHVPERKAGLLLTTTLIAFGVGRFFTAYLMRWISAGTIMFGYALVNLALLGLALLQRNWVGVVAILATSFFMSMMFPTIFALGLSNATDNPNLGGSFIVMMIVGGAVLTPIMGHVAETSTALGYTIPMIAYAVVAGFALYCSRRGTKSQAAAPGTP